MLRESRNFLFFMPLTIDQKKDIVADLKENLKKQRGIILVDFGALPAGELAELRRQLREKNCLLQVVKKSLLIRALTEEGLPREIDHSGSMALVFGFNNSIAPAKIAYKFAQKEERLKILGGIWDNEIRDPEQVSFLAQLPSYEELLARLVWILKSPMTGLIGVLDGTLRNLVVVLSEIQRQKN